MYVEYKGGSVHLNSPVIILTSCLPPSELYQVQESLAQLRRRLTMVLHFGLLTTVVEM